MFQQLIKSLNPDKDFSPRSIMIDMYTRVLNGELYDGLPYFFFQEYDFGGKYIPLHLRKPSVRENLCKLVVDESVSLLFGSDHFPEINCANPDLLQILNALICDAKLVKTMIEAATTGSVGSVALILRILEEKIDIDVLSTQYLTPQFDPKNAYKLIKLTEKYKVKGRDLIEMGYDNIDEANGNYWFQREWDDVEERYFLPFKKSETPKRDDERSFSHELGFVPAVWIKNLPKPGYKGKTDIDGACTFAAAIETNIELEYQLSQAGRALKYSADPLVVFKVEDDLALANNAIDVSGDINNAKKIVRSSNNALVLGKEDDAKLLEINGRASQAVLEYVRCLREAALESIHGNRTNADKVNAAQSGLAMQAMNQPLIWLADKLRIYYGECGLLPLIRMIMEATHKKTIRVEGNPVHHLDLNESISLKWPHWYPTTPSDKQQISNALKVLADSKHISQKSAVTFIADDYGIQNIEEEMQDIDADQQKILEQNPKLMETISV